MDEPKPMKELTRVREERGLSQQRLANASGVNKATINQIERGRRSPNARTLEKLAEALNVEVADLFPKAQAPLPLEPMPPERGYRSLTSLLEDWGYLFKQTAEQWKREAESGNLFGSADGALSYSIATNIQAAQFFAVIGERLLPTVENLLPEDLAYTERQKLLEARETLIEATDAVNEATLAAVPELAEEREFTDAELAMIEEAAKEFEALPELEQRRQMREAWQIVDRIIQEQDSEANDQASAAG
jgi:transcriptional regulator with XRE-family HTH domain